MHINTIGNYSTTRNNYLKSGFKALIKDKSALPVIDKMSECDKLEFKKIEKRLAKTKFWDLKISSIGNTFREFKFHFIDKNQQHGIISDGIYPYDQQGDTIRVYSIIYGPENTSRNTVESLKFKSKDRAEELYEKYIQNLEIARYRQFNLTPIESLRNKEVELNMLEESSQTPEQAHSVTYASTDLQTKDMISNNVVGDEASDLIE